MKAEHIAEAIAEAKKFIERAEVLHKQMTEEARPHAFPGYEFLAYEFLSYEFPKESGALRRQSMELTRALSKMRQGK